MYARVRAVKGRGIYAKISPVLYAGSIVCCEKKRSVEGSENKQLVPAILCLSSCVSIEVGRSRDDDACDSFYSVRPGRV